MSANTTPPTLVASLTVRLYSDRPPEVQGPIDNPTLAMQLVAVAAQAFVGAWAQKELRDRGGQVELASEQQADSLADVVGRLRQSTLPREVRSRRD